MNERERERGCENNSNQRPLTNIYLHKRESERERVRFSKSETSDIRACLKERER